MYIWGKFKTVLVTGHSEIYGCETSRFPHFLDIRLRDDSDVSLTLRPPFTPKEDSWHSIMLEP
jgi:hypothetical protein